MVKVYFDTQYPKTLVDSLQLFHSLQTSKEYEIIRSKQIEEIALDQAVIFLFDTAKKGLDIITEKHFECGYKVFAFKINQVSNFDFFQLSLSVMSLWPKMLEQMNSSKKPFIFTYKYWGNSLKKVK